MPKPSSPATRIFIPQSVMDGWLSEDQVEMAGDVATLRAAQVGLRLVPASYFLRVSAGDDRDGLLGKVKDQEGIAALGGEAYMTSVILAETAYDVEPGFLATPIANGALAVAALRALGG